MTEALLALTRVSFSREDSCRMADKIQCATHGECQKTLVCSHLLGEVRGSGSTEASLRRTTRSPTLGVMIVNLYALLMADGMNNPRSLQKSRCSVRAATNGLRYEIRALQSLLKTWLAFDGSVVAARNGTPGRASISVTIHRIIGAKSMKERAIELHLCQGGARTVTKPS